MAGDDVSVESVEIALLSEIGMSSAIEMKNAYLQPPGEIRDGERYVPYREPITSPVEDQLTGPNALVYLTKIVTRISGKEIEHLLKDDAGHKKITRTPEFYAVVLTMSMRLGDPSTTRFINGIVDISFPQGVTILNYSPKDQGIITAVIESGGNAISLSRDLDFLAPAVPGTKNPPDNPEHRFGIPVGPGEIISGTYSKKTGYSFAIPAGVLLEYQGMLKNDHEMFWEIYPPMPTVDNEITGKEMQAVFSLIIRAPEKILPEIRIQVEGRVKGNLWGVVPVKGSMVLL
ncbi:MAG: hypothetical protein CVV30_06345 [Methanomicrobiales archaeon HGW-Methanomicrobiales-1]|nr:MAG: hypothetical protein CVV30_06345 [Methanomicrobiales archaeon HGW-Methanomicrobiales-1]